MFVTGIYRTEVDPDSGEVYAYRAVDDGTNAPGPRPVVCPCADWRVVASCDRCVEGELKP